jgi:hypothetical protein
MTDRPPERRVQVVSQGFNSWKVQVLFNEQELSAAEISNRLQEVKNELAASFGVPNSLLEYNRLLDKRTTRHGLLVEMQISKQQTPSGVPVFRTLPLTADDGTVFSDMRLTADLFPYDEFDKPLTDVTLQTRLSAEGYDPECVNYKVLSEALQTLEQTLRPLEDIEIGRGILPGLGRSSRLTYGIPPDQESFLSSAWIGVRPAHKGEFVVEVSSAVGGHAWGRNVLGRELEPRQGLQTKLEPGDGTQLTLRGTQLTALRDGLLVFERFGRDKRDRDSAGIVPGRLVGHVRTMNAYHETQVFEHEFIEPTAIFADVLAGSRIRSRAPLFIGGNIESHAHVECSASLRVAGNVHQAELIAAKHLAVSGNISDSALKAGLTLHASGRVVDSTLQAAEVVAAVVQGGSVEALQRTAIGKVNDDGGVATAVRINLRKHLENQQLAGREALDDLLSSLNQILSIFGPELTVQASESSAQRLLLKWLRLQKDQAGLNYTHAEMQEFRAVLEMVPLIHEQLKAVGLELRDVTSRLATVPPETGQ